MERESEDGFLVVPDANGQVKDARQLFGTRMKVDGQTYADGFKTLQAFSKKDCESPNPKERYLGPWDKDLFFGDKAIKVWVDKNRNGTSDEGEISSLQESGIAAINTCYIEHNQTFDKFQNRTELRSAFLYVGDEEINDFFSSESLEDEVVQRITEGKTTDGKDATFRAVIDIYFNSKPKEFLTTVDYDIVFDTEEENNQETAPNAPDIVTKVETFDAGQE